jgi:PQQ-like domain
MKTRHLLVTLALTSLIAVAADWPQWRGKDRMDHSPDAATLTEWPEGGPKQTWLFKEAGLGYSGFSLMGGKLFTMGAMDGGESVVCIDAKTGKKVWSRQIDGSIYENQWGDGPRCTPTLDDGHAYAISGGGVLACLSMADGKVIWEKHLIKDLGGKLQQWGYTESPLIEGDVVICTPGGGKGTLAGLNKKTGEMVWQSKEMTEEAQYSSPVSYTHEGKRQVAQLVSKKLFAVDPKDGALLWEADFAGKIAVIPTPIYHNGHIYVTAGYGVGCRMFKLGGKSPELVYENNNLVNHHGGVILVDGKLYGHSDKGGWTCQDFMTGEAAWQSKDLGKGAVGYVAGHLICVDEGSGEVALVEASDKGWKQKSRFKLSPQTTQRKPQGRIWVHPVIVDGQLFLRDQEIVYCYDVKAK